MARSPTVTATDPVEYLDLDDLVVLVDLARTLLGDPPPICDVGLLGSAAARARATTFGQHAYPDLLTRALRQMRV